MRWPRREAKAVQYSRWVGVTLDSDYEIQSVTHPPLEPATPVQRHWVRPVRQELGRAGGVHGCDQRPH